MTTTLRSFHPPAALRPASRTALVRVMRAGASVLHRWAERIAAAEQPADVEAMATTMPRLEFHCEAGAPEGALYVDGMLFGHVQGARRL
jgi:hypothetical protein